MRKPMTTSLIAAAVLATTTLGATSALAHGNRPKPPGNGVTTVATGLDNPRGLTFGPDGSLYVAEAGRGGTAPCFEGPEGPACFGASGAITKVRHGHQREVVSGLPSIGGEGTGEQAIGPSDVVVSDGKLYFTVGLGGDPALRASLPPLAREAAAWLLRQSRWTGWAQVTDLGAFEAAENPDGDLPDTNPNSLVAHRWGFVVADAGANALVSVDRRGRASTVAVFPERMVSAPPELGLPPGTQLPMDAVPTSVVRGRDGAYYVGQLTGFPFPVGGANVYRVVPGQEPQVYASGFTNIIDLGFGPDGRLYVLEMFHNGVLSGDPTGALLRVQRDGSAREVMTTGLVTPGGLTFDRRAAYVSNCGTCAGTGSVLRIPLR